MEGSDMDSISFCFWMGTPKAHSCSQGGEGEVQKEAKFAHSSSITRAKRGRLAKRSLLLTRRREGSGGGQIRSCDT